MLILILSITTFFSISITAHAGIGQVTANTYKLDAGEMLTINCKGTKVYQVTYIGFHGKGKGTYSISNSSDQDVSEDFDFKNENDGYIAPALSYNKEMDSAPIFDIVVDEGEITVEINTANIGEPDVSKTNTQYNSTNITINVMANKREDITGINSDKETSIIDNEEKLSDFSIKSQNEVCHIVNSSKTSIDLQEAKESGVTVSKDNYQDYIIPKEVFESIEENNAYPTINVKLSKNKNDGIEYISTAFAKANDDSQLYRNTITTPLKIIKGNSYKIILKSPFIKNDTIYYIKQNNKIISSKTGIFEGKIFDNFDVNKDVYAYTTSENGKSTSSKMLLNILPDDNNKALNNLLNESDCSILGEKNLTTAVTNDNLNNTNNNLLGNSNLEFDLSSFNVPVSVDYDASSGIVQMALGISDFKWKNGKENEFSCFINDFKKIRDDVNKNKVWNNIQDSFSEQYSDTKKSYDNTKALKKKYGGINATNVSKDWDLEIIGYVKFEVIWETTLSGKKEPRLKCKEGEAVFTGKFEYDYSEPIFLGPVPAYIYLGWGAELSSKVTCENPISLTNDPVDWSFELDFTPDLTLGAGIGMKDLLSAGLYGNASVPISLNPATQNKEGNFKIDLSGEIGIEGSALFIFKTRIPLLESTVNLIDKKWIKDGSTQLNSSGCAFSSNFATGKNDIVSTNRNYIKNTSEWNKSSNLKPTGDSKEKSKIDSGIKYNILQESVFEHPQTQLACVGNKILMVYVEDDTTRSKNNRMKLMYTLYDFNSNSWSQPQPVDDDGKNDSYPYLVSDEKNAYLVWIKSKDLYPNDLSNSSDVLKGCEVYFAKFDTTKKAFVNNERITYDDIYDYNPIVAIDNNGNPIIYYASCTDNNPHGNNNIITKISNDKSVIAKDKSYILSITTSNKGDKCVFLMDKNNSSKEKSKVNAFIIQDEIETEINHNKAISEAFFANLNGRETLFYSDRSNIYYLDNLENEISCLPNNTNISSEVKTFETNKGLSFLFLKSGSKTSELFTSTQTEHGWSSPIQISRENCLLDSFDIIQDNGTIYGSLTKTYDKQTDLVAFSYNDFIDISLGDIYYTEANTLSGNNNSFEISLTNKGTKKVNNIDFTICDTLGTDIKQTVQVNIEPGETKNIKLKYPISFNYSKTTLKVEADIEGDVNTDNNISTKIIGLPDLSLESPTIEEFPDYYIVTSNINNLSRIYAEDINVSFIINNDTTIGNKKIKELSVFDKKEISMIVMKKDLIFDKEGIANIKFQVSSKSGDGNPEDNEIVSLLTNNYKNQSEDNPTTTTISSIASNPTIQTTESSTIMSTISTEPSGFIGDVNGDGTTNIKDAVIIQKYIVHILDFTNEQIKVADVNSDGIVDIKDATNIQKYVVRLTNKLG